MSFDIPWLHVSGNQNNFPVKESKLCVDWYNLYAKYSSEKLKGHP